MKAGVHTEKQTAFQFVLDELLPVRPAVRQAFG